MDLYIKSLIDVYIDHLTLTVLILKIKGLYVMYIVIS